MSVRMPQFNCAKCPAYCCSYAEIGATDADIKRLAKHFGMTPEKARKKFTKTSQDGKSQILRHQKDEHYGTVCQFLDTETRRCTVYHARPHICRAFPGTHRCGYYDFLSFERRMLEDKDYISTTWNN
jgi:Fe-S-cluster containining protein